MSVAFIMFLLTVMAVEDRNSCEHTFLREVRSGHIWSMHGLGIREDYSQIYVTHPLGDEGQAGLVRYRCANGQWADPEPLFTGSLYTEYQPFLTVDEKWLLFTSTRPIERTGPAIRQNVWAVQLDDAGELGQPFMIEHLSSPSWDGHAVMTSEGTILFASNRDGGKGMVDIYSAGLEASDLLNVGPLNTEISDNDLFLSRSEQVLLFSRYDPETEDIDIFFSHHSGEGWSVPTPVEEINTDAWELSPILTPDEKHLIFVRGEPRPMKIIETSELRSLDQADANKNE